MNPDRSPAPIAHRTTAHRAIQLALIACIATLSGCEGNGWIGSGDNDRGGYRTTSFADAEEVLQKFNNRAQRIQTLWARASVVVEGRDAEGTRLRERAEGHLQIIPPDRFALSLGKLGETNLYFGSNQTIYWWFDMIDADNKAAYFGRHEQFSPEKIRDLGIPVHPLDLIDTLGITPLPADEGQIVARPGPKPGSIVVAAPTRHGIRRATIDAETGEPSRIELIGAGGRIMISADMSRYTLMAGLEQGEAPLRIPGRVIVHADGFDGEIRFSLHDPDRRDIRPVAFDPAALVDAYRIPALYDLDIEQEQSTPRPATPRPATPRPAAPRSAAPHPAGAPDERPAEEFPTGLAE